MSKRRGFGGFSTVQVKLLESISKVLFYGLLIANDAECTDRHFMADGDPCDGKSLPRLASDEYLVLHGLACFVTKDLETAGTKKWLVVRAVYYGNNRYSRNGAAGVVVQYKGEYAPMRKVIASQRLPQGLGLDPFTACVELQ